MMITTTEQLQEVCDRFSNLPFVTLDTEFIREKTYYPVLCLIQIGAPDEAHCIDPLAEGLDLNPLFRLLENPNVVKVFHAARQDLEIFVHLMGKVPQPLFDTQIAAMVCGFDESASYQQLVRDLTGVSLDKGMRFTDWAKRPLSDKQVEYALHDVTHLVEVYQKLQERLQENGRWDWLEEEISILNNPQTYDPDNESVWKRTRCPLTNQKQIHVYAKVCAWREKTAKAKNRPRRHIMKDEALLELAAMCPKTKEEMDSLRAMPSGFSKSAAGAELLETIVEALNDNSESYERTPPPKPLTKNQKILAELLRLLLEVMSAKLGVASKILAHHEDINDFVRNKEGARILSGWRYEAFGRHAENLRDGKLFFGFDSAKKSVKIFNAE